MSDEEEGKIEKTFINDLGAKYPMAKINKSDTQKYGIRFYPSIYCFAPDGNLGAKETFCNSVLITASLGMRSSGTECTVPSGAKQ